VPLLTSLELSKQDERLRWLELIRSNLAGYRPGATALQVEGVAAALLRSLGHLGLLAVLWQWRTAGTLVDGHALVAAFKAEHRPGLAHSCRWGRVRCQSTYIVHPKATGHGPAGWGQTASVVRSWTRTRRRSGRCGSFWPL
jgi:hypothetical protein